MTVGELLDKIEQVSDLRFVLNDETISMRHRDDLESRLNDLLNTEITKGDNTNETTKSTD